MHTIIEVKPHGSWWKVVEAPGAEPIFPNKEEALLHATKRLSSGTTEIRILDGNGAIERTIGS